MNRLQNYNNTSFNEVLKHVKEIEKKLPYNYYLKNPEVNQVVEANEVGLQLYYVSNTHYATSIPNTACSPLVDRPDPAARHRAWAGDRRQPG